MKHDHHQHCQHTLAFCEKCDIPYCTKCNYEWANPCTLNHYNWWVNTQPQPWGTTTTGANTTISIPKTTWVSQQTINHAEHVV